jgi:hypothetical protein
MLKINKMNLRFLKMKITFWYKECKMDYNKKYNKNYQQ